ncbi:MAG: extracellular solute-binding protein [Caldilineaceae bacterium]|nr:extracellular solute-binding protein [Caldilineaceae bacterium]
MQKSTLFLVSIVVLTLSACTWFTGESASPEEGKLLVYTTLRQDEIDLYLDDFAIAYPNVDIELTQMPAATLIRQMLAERDDPKADLLWGVGLTSVLYLEWNDLLKPYAPVGLARVEDRFRDTNQPPYWVGNSLALTAFCVNADEIARLGVSQPTGWQDLLDPGYRRAILMADPARADTGLMAVMGILELLGEQEGWRYLDALHPNIAYYPEDETEPCRLVDRGEYAIGIAKTFDSLGNVEMVYPREKAGWELTVSALVRKDTIAPAARTFLDWSISDPVMRLYTRKNALTAAPTGLSTSPGFPRNPEPLLVDRNMPWSAANRERILAEWQRRYGDKVRQDSAEE